MSGPIDLAEFRKSREDPTCDGLICKCGSAWFDAAVVMTTDLRVTGHSGAKCRECGEAL